MKTARFRGSRLNDSAPLIVRLAQGSLMAGHGAEKLFGSFGGPGLEGTSGFMEMLGMRPEKVAPCPSASPEDGRARGASQPGAASVPPLAGGATRERAPFLDETVFPVAGYVLQEAGCRRSMIGALGQEARP